ncbi:2-keto-3-deoxygluconate kinase [Streptomyces himastatinicus ATCC 53653]|uniref:2-keto-3-deoxygluconate kinase n=1 Tax=Streptomyces himastatinicus ATCC 53653 TaxID=457427 RepID=D9WE87_9ACTN|nr:sugar kinase [Streptomyces himastatinicus]EFL23126.1 2-keto-3-deoxygluconate kinase [Streptomyces himastatinicus ATCC 53653]
MADLQPPTAPADDPNEVLCLGESMVLVTPRQGQRLATAPDATFSVAGAESNVAQYLADLGHRVAWASRVGSDPLGDRVLTAVAGPGVDVRYVERDPSAPTAVFFKDPSPEDGTRVHYYRTGSAASRLAPAYLDTLPIASARLVHLSGINAALSASCARAATALFDRARAAGVLRSFDVNYRPGLWRTEDAAAPLLALARQADVVFVGLDEAAEVWGTTTAEDVRDLIGPSVSVVVKNAEVGAVLFEPGGGPGTFVPAEAVEVVEPVGAGDAFAAGYLSAWLRGDAPAERLRLGHRVAAFALGSVEDHADATSLRRPSPDLDGAAR